MHIVRTIQAMRHERALWNESVGLVPTMGFLHEGHLSLMRKGRAEQEKLVASIFVNPTQFGPNEDLESYPRDTEHDLHLLETVGVDTVFLPSVSEMYPQGFATYITPTGPAVEQGEGAIRPTHFRGVATVVTKLFQIIQPRYAYFGQKDAQQVTVLQQVTRDLNIPVTIKTGPTIREADGLAMSSRNSYLTPQQREQAAILYHALQAGQQVQQHNQHATAKHILQAVQATIEQEPEIQLDYADLRDPVTFLPLAELGPSTPALLLVAAKVGTTRLIDNFALRTDGTWDTGVLIADIQEKR